MCLFMYMHMLMFMCVFGCACVYIQVIGMVSCGFQLA